MKELRKNALIFIILIGLVSLFSDMCHEGAKSIYGQFLQLSGASPKIISLIGGLGEFLGTALIFVTSIIASKTKKYWTMTIIGYTLNLFCIPLLALTTPNGYIYAISLILLERVGKAIRKPAKNTLVSFSSKNIGEGKSFALMEFLDQIGAFIGPLLLTLVLSLKNGTNIFDDYRFCFLILLVPAVVTIIILLFTAYKYPTPEEFEEESVKENKTNVNYSKSFIVYLVAIALIGFSFIDFPLISLDILNKHIINESYLPLLYALAMLIDSISALVFGTLFDKIGMKTLVVSTICSMFFPLLIFRYDNLSIVITGVALWGIGMGAIESILKSSVAKMSTIENRSKCFGIFEGVFGLAWFIGSAILGFIYEYNNLFFITLPIVLQTISVILFIYTVKLTKVK